MLLLPHGSAAPNPLQARGESDELDTANVTSTNDTASPASYRLGMKSMPTGGVMNSRHTRRLTIALGLVLTIAALVAPSANAKMQRIYSDHGVALVPVSSEPNPNMVYSDRGVAPIAPESKSTPIHIYSDHGIATIPPAQSEPTQIASVSTDDPSFNWSKTGYIVSLSMVGLLLLGGGALLVGKHNRRRPYAAA